MPFLTWLASKLTGEALKAGTEVAKTATEIPKNLAETEKARLEVAELKRAHRERETLIQSANFEDVKNFDRNMELFRDQQKEKSNSPLCTAGFTSIARGTSGS